MRDRSLVHAPSLLMAFTLIAGSSLSTANAHRALEAQGRGDAEWEEKFRAIPQAERIKESMRVLSAEPHQRYPHAEFYQVYGWRRRQETYYDRIKNIFELERFSGLTPLAITQDFYGVLFLATLESTLAQSAQIALTARAATGPARVAPRVNRAVSYVSLLDHTVALLADPQRSLEEAATESHWAGAPSPQPFEG